MVKCVHGIRSLNRHLQRKTTSLKNVAHSMYFELHDIIFLQSVIDGKYNVKDESIPVSVRNSTTRQSSDFELSKNRFYKTDENLWTRAPKLFNIHHYHFQDNPKKKQLTERYFKISYSHLDTCTWRVFCSCGSCNPYQRLMPAEN